MSNKKKYVEELKHLLAPIAFYVWKPIGATDLEDNVDYVQFRLLFSELTNEHLDIIKFAGNLKFVYSIDLNVDLRGKKYLLVKLVELHNLLELKTLYEEKMLETRIHLDYINDKISKHT